MTKRSVPVLSLKKYTEGTEKDKLEFSQELYSAFKEYGFVIIKNHSIPKETLDKAYQLSEQFFKLPVENKMKYFVPGIGGDRGYTPFGKENAKGNKFKDLKEFWHVGPELSKNSPYYKKEKENLWPEEIHEFKEVFVDIFRELNDAGAIILEALTYSLQIPKDFFEKRIVEGNSILRLLHYPPIDSKEDPRCIRAAAHGDINLITLLVASTASGLELLDKDGTWLPVEASPDTIIVNIGDMLSRITNDVLPSTIHRVVNPEDATTSRYSMPFFLSPKPDVLLTCLDSCKNDGIKHSDILAGEFLNERLKEIGLKK